MLNKNLLIITLLLLVGCAGNHGFTTRQPVESDLPIKKTVWVTGFNSHFDFDGVGGTAYQWPGRDDECLITVTKPIDPHDRVAFCTIGHELWHCLTGDFHQGEDVKCD